MTRRLIVESRVREHMKSLKLGVTRLAPGVMDVLDREVEKLIMVACERAREDKRATLTPCDAIAIVDIEPPSEGG